MAAFLASHNFSIPEIGIEIRSGHTIRGYRQLPIYGQDALFANDVVRVELLFSSGLDCVGIDTTIGLFSGHILIPHELKSSMQCSADLHYASRRLR